MPLKKKRKRRRVPRHVRVRADHMLSWHSNIDDVNRLMEIHAKVAGSGAGYKDRVEVLNKSGIVLLVACWEAFTEDLAKAAFDMLLKHARSPRDFPAKVLTRASREIRGAPDERRVWELAEDGWRNVLRSHRARVLKKHLGTFNTPKTEPLDHLFEALLGMNSLSSSWSWRGMPVTRSRVRLDKLVETRGEIAHRVSASRAIYKADVRRHTAFLVRLAVASHMKVRAYLRSRLGFYVWFRYRVKVRA